MDDEIYSAKSRKLKERPILIVLGEFQYRPQQWKLFDSGELRKRWAENYPDIFDERDIRTANNQSGTNGMRYHFHEWLAAVLIFNTYGYYSLIESYEYAIQARKRKIIERILPHDVLSLVTNHRASFGAVQCPDLFTYSPDESDWFFCEVKGPKDKLREKPKRFFEELARVSGKEIRLVQFRS